MPVVVIAVPDPGVVDEIVAIAPFCVNTILVPSGDQLGSAFVPALVSWRSVLPESVQTRMFEPEA